MKSILLRELSLLLTLFGFGLVVLPAAIYWVGQYVIGEYADGGGAWDLMRALWIALLQGHGLAWLLVLIPYAVWQLLRLTRLIWRARKTREPRHSFASR